MVTVGAYWDFLADLIVGDGTAWLDQCAEWVGTGLVEPDQQYISKGNMGFTGPIDPGKLNLELLAVVQRYMPKEGPLAMEGDAGRISYLRATVPLLHATEEIRLVIHMHTFAITHATVTGFLQYALDIILDTALDYPSACVVKVIVRGEPEVRPWLPIMLDRQTGYGTEALRKRRVEHWAIRDEGDAWAVEEHASVRWPGATLVKPKSRFALVFEQI